MTGGILHVFTSDKRLRWSELTHPEGADLFRG